MSNHYYPRDSYANRINSTDSYKYKYQQQPTQFSSSDSKGDFEATNPFVEVQVNYFSTMDSLKRDIPYSNTVLKHRIESSFNCFTQINGKYGKTFFLIGYILVEDIISQIDSSSAYEASRLLLDSFYSAGRLQELDHQEKTLFTKLRFKLQDFFIKAEGLKSMLLAQVDATNKIASFLCEEIMKDKELILALIQGARCYLIQNMLARGVSLSEMSLFDKFTKSEWAVPDMYDEEILTKFSETSEIKLNIFEMNSFEIKEKLIGSSLSQREVSLVLFTTRYKEFSAVLFQPKKHHSTIKKEDDQAASSSIQPCQVCTLCQEEIMSDLVYKNPLCEHAYCFYCLKDCGDPNLNFCYYLKCPKKIVQSDIMRFYQKCVEKESSNQPLKEDFNNSKKNERIFSETTPSKNPRALCSSCFKESSDINPQFVNKECQHAFCRSCLMSNRLSFRGKCLNWDCLAFVNLEDLKDFMKQFDLPNSSILTRCGNCFKSFNVNEFFQSSTCRHLLCHVCVDQLKSSACPLSECKRILNQEAILSFKESFLFEQESQNISEKTFVCSHCHQSTNLYLLKDSKFDYWKCQHCSCIYCTTHEKSMKDCLCLCPKCLGDFTQENHSGGKLCEKCLIWYCKQCLNEVKIGQECTSCGHQEEIANQNKMILEVVKTEYKNLCNVCEDFREFPEFLQLDCNHKMCEFCILARRKEYSDINYIACPLCDQ